MTKPTRRELDESREAHARLWNRMASITAKHFSYPHVDAQQTVLEMVSLLAVTEPPLATKMRRQEEDERDAET